MKLYCNKNLDEHIGFHARLYDEFVGEHRWDKSIPFIHYPYEYNGDELMKLCCSQHSRVVAGEETISDYQRKKITDSWVEYLREQILPVKEVQACTIVPQRVFDVLCNQTSIESLRIKVLRGKNVDNITKLINLKKLFIESASGLLDIRPIAQLPNLEVLILGNTKKITDYSPLGKLKNVKVFGICSYPGHNSIMYMDDDSFMREMSALSYVDMFDVRIGKQTFLTPENVKAMDFAAFYM